MKIFSKIFCICAIAFSISSCSNTWISAPYTSPSKMVKVTEGMSVQDVNSTLGIPAYDIHHLQENGGSILTYKYRKQFRKAIVNSEEQLHNEESQTKGTVWYKNPSSVYVFFKDQKMTALITDAGIRDSEALLIDDNMIHVLSKEEIDLFMLAKNDATQDSTFRYDIRALKNTGKISIYQTYLLKQKVEVTITSRLPSNFNTRNITKKRSIPSYPSQTISRNYNNSISVGAYANVPALMYERVIYKTGRVKFGASLGLGVDFIGQGFSLPFYGFAALSFGKKQESSLELNLGGSLTIGPYGFVMQGVPFSIGYRLEHKKFFFRTGLGVGIYKSYGRSYVLPAAHFALGVRF